MTVYEVLKIVHDLLETLSRAGIHFNDFKYIKLYEDYQADRVQAEKISYIVAVLSERYGVSERSVYNVIRRLENDCNITSL